MRVLVTGGTGAIGQFVTQELLDEGHEVVALSRHAPPSAGSLRGVTWVSGDVGDLAGLTATLQDRQVDRAIHLAAVLLESDQDPYLGFRTNSLGTTTLFEAARRAGTERVVYASTKAVFGPITGVWGHPTYRPIREEHSCRPNSMYGLSKLIAEQTAAYYRERFSQDIVVIRFGTTCGPNKGARHGSSRITSQLIENAVQGRPTRIEQGGDQRDDIIYNRDVARGLTLACLAPRLEHSTYHLGTGVLITLHDLADAIRARIPVARIEIGPGLDYMQLGMGTYCRMATGRARRELGFAPRYALADWIGEYVDLLGGPAARN